jgi:quercetin dioxygenase-like cupin family protein
MRAVVIVLMALAGSACAHGSVSASAWLRGVTFAPVGFARGVEAAFITGAQNAPGLYTIRVHIAEHGLMPPHTHPDTRVITVLSGEIRFAQGETFNAASAQRYAAGDFFVVPAMAPHYVWASDSEGVYQESGVGPTATVPLP